MIHLTEKQLEGLAFKLVLIGLFGGFILGQIR
jgi:hypothetical protein